MPKRSSELGLWAHRTDLHKDQEVVIGHKESGIEARKLDSHRRGKEKQTALCSPLLEPRSGFCRPATEAGKTVSLAGWKLAGRAEPPTWLEWGDGIEGESSLLFTEGN